MSSNRIVKIVKPRTATGLKDQSHWKYTYYLCDASGNPRSRHALHGVLVADTKEVK